MKLKALRAGTFPTGCHWMAGEVRVRKMPKGTILPDWLVEVKEKPKAAKKGDDAKKG
tara:strand:- start:267 stop:437 length:171 start_codon:yes stop_codon:yes gene_type:complete